MAKKSKKPKKPTKPKKRDVHRFTKRARELGEQTMATASDKASSLKKQLSNYAKEHRRRQPESKSSPMRRALDSTVNGTKKATGKANDALRRFTSSRHHQHHSR